MNQDIEPAANVADPVVGDTHPVDMVAALRQAATPHRRQGRWGWWLLGASAGFVVVVLIALVVVAVRTPRVTVAEGSHRLHHAVPTPATTGSGHATPVQGVPVLRPPSSAAGALVRAVGVAAGWFTMIRSLDDARVAALVQRDPARLSGIDAPGSQAGVADAALVASMRTKGVAPDGFRLDVHSVTLVSRTSTHVRLRVVDSRPTYRWLGASGEVVGVVAARASTTWTVDLVHGGVFGWLVQDVGPSARVPAAAGLSRPVQPRASPQSLGP